LLQSSLWPRRIGQSFALSRLAHLGGKTLGLVRNNGEPTDGFADAATSMVALSARRLVCAAMLLMRLLTSPISSTDVDRLATASVMALASSVA
jgi:hypothetical protein